MVEETKRLLRCGAEGLLADTSGGEGASAAFSNFRQGVVWAQSGKWASPADLLAEVTQKTAVVGSLVTLFGVKKILRRQISYVLKLLIDVSVPWELAWHECSVPADALEGLGIPHGAEAAAEATVRAEIASKDNEEKAGEAAAPAAPTDAVVDDARALLKEGAAGLLSGSDDGAGEAFSTFRRGVLRAESCVAVEPQTVLEEVASKPEIVSALLALLRKRKIYRKQISASLQKLVEGSPSWAEAWNQTSVQPEEHEIVGIPHKSSSSMDLQLEGDASPGSCPSPEEKQLKLLRQGLAELESINFDSSARKGILAFRWLSSGMSAEGRGAVLDSFSQKEEVLEFLLELHGLKRLYRQSIAHCIAEILKQQNWARVVAESTGLRQRLKEQLQMHLQAESQAGGTAGGQFQKAGSELLRQVLILETVVAPSMGEKLLKQVSTCSIGDEISQQPSSESLGDTGEDLKEQPHEETTASGHAIAEMPAQTSMVEDLVQQPSPLPLAEDGGELKKENCAEAAASGPGGAEKSAELRTAPHSETIQQPSPNSLPEGGEDLKEESRAEAALSGPDVAEKSAESTKAPHSETNMLVTGMTTSPKASSPAAANTDQSKRAPATSGYSGFVETSVIDMHLFTAGGDRLEGKAFSQALKRYSPKSNTNPCSARSIIITKQKSIIVVESFDSFDFAKTVYDIHTDSKVLYALQGGVLVEMTSKAWAGLLGLGKDTKGVELIRAFATTRVNALIDGSASQQAFVRRVPERAAVGSKSQAKGIEDDATLPDLGKPHSATDCAARKAKGTEDDTPTLPGLSSARSAIARAAERAEALEYIRSLAKQELQKLQQSGDVDSVDLEATLDDYMSAYAEQVDEEISEEGHSWATYPRQHGLALFNLHHFLRLRTFLSRHR
eukprot:TRINITY_DN72970_c0_g1_i1.p1 TRINITY_DN72970_c0_g1~~TRINITY_DN72970_c0_g1_i1.p1  ORF type:complete len:908 (-),score=188.25 TRINITY_DN72970_c0_g1_i1:19-2715(-)